MKEGALAGLKDTVTLRHRDDGRQDRVKISELLPLAAGKNPLRDMNAGISKSTRISYGIMAGLLILIGIFHLGTLVLTAFFGYFALQQFSFGRSKILGVLLYLVAVVAIGFSLFAFSKQAYRTLPKIADDTIPADCGLRREERH